MFEYYDYDYRQPPFPGMPFGPQFSPPMDPPATPPGGSTSGPPSGPPPSFTPQQAQAHGHGPGVFAVDPGAIRPCLFRFVYLWLNTGESFWAWLVFVGPRSAAGWRWTGRRWIYFGIDLREIRSFTCF
jgi:hypothetical protein